MNEGTSEVQCRECGHALHSSLSVACSEIEGQGESQGCIHRGRWHDSYSQCTMKCVWKLGRANLGSCHYSCCYSLDRDNPHCAANMTHAFGPVRHSQMVSTRATLGAGLSIVCGGFGRLCWRSVETIVKDRGAPTFCGEIGRGYTWRWCNQPYDGCLAMATRLVSLLCRRAGGHCKRNRIAAWSRSAATDRVRSLCSMHIHCCRRPRWASSPYAHNGLGDSELQQLTIQVDFVSGGQTVFRATTWAGYVGVLTGMRPQGYSVSVNYRRTEFGASDGVGGIFRNMQRGAAGHWRLSLFEKCSRQRIHSTLLRCFLRASSWLQFISPLLV